MTGLRQPDQDAEILLVIDSRQLRAGRPGVREERGDGTDLADLGGFSGGRGEGTGQNAANAIQDAYKGLRDALKRRLAGKPAAQEAVEQYTNDPEAWRATSRCASSRPE